MKKILITSRPWEKRVAIIDQNLLFNVFFDSKVSNRLERSFFKGKVVKVLKGVQSSFVQIDQPKAGFLHVSEIDRDMAFRKINGEEEIEDDSLNNENKEKNNFKEIDISNILKENDDILVQVSKEPINEKGAKLTTCFTLPGRFVVLMPNIPKIAISKKIVDPEERRRLKEIVFSFLPETAGCIIRTTCEGRKDSEIIQDLRYLFEVWEEIQKKFKEAKSEECIYKDIDLTKQVIRDHLDESVENIICDDEETYKSVLNFIEKVAPEFSHRVSLYKEKQPLFEYFNVEKQIQQALQSRVDLESGGSIIIESTEAMTVIDVNTARYSGSTKLEETILKTNLEAAKEIVRQLRLRNVGGLVVIDFIDMATATNKNKLFSFFEKALKEAGDKSQSVVLKISEFGLVQMTRKRTGKTLSQHLKECCKDCNGTGSIKSLPTKIYEVFRTLEKFINSKNYNDYKGCFIIVNRFLASYIIDLEYETLLSLEKKYGLNFVVKECEETEKSYDFEFFV